MVPLVIRNETMLVLKPMVLGPPHFVLNPHVFNKFNMGLTWYLAEKMHFSWD